MEKESRQPLEATWGHMTPASMKASPAQHLGIPSPVRPPVTGRCGRKITFPWLMYRHGRCCRHRGQTSPTFFLGLKGKLLALEKPPLEWSPHRHVQMRNCSREGCGGCDVAHWPRSLWSRNELGCGEVNVVLRQPPGGM